MPTYLQNGVIGYSNTIYPVTNSTANSSLFDIDKPIYYLLDFCAGMLNTYQGARFTAEANRAGRADLANGIVQDKRPYNPVPYLADASLIYPTLAIWRGEGKMEKMESLSYYRVVTELHLLWILPPLTAAEREIFQPLLTGGLAILKDRNESGWDPYYQSGALIGHLAGYETLNCKSYEIAEFPNEKTNLPFVSLYMGLEMWEIPQIVSGEFETVTGIDGYVNLDGYPPPWDNFVETNSDYQPEDFDDE